MAKKENNIKVDNDMNNLVEKISVDLPSIEEIRAADGIRNPNPYYISLGEKIKTTDIAKMTGATESYGNSYRFYLRDLEPDDEYNILYSSTRYLTSQKDEVGDSYSKNLILHNRYRTSFAILPTLHFDKCPEIFDLLVKFYGNQDGTIDLGEMPQDFAAKGMQIKLNRDSVKDVHKIDETFVFNGQRPFAKYNPKTPFIPKVHPVYEYKGAKYLHWKITGLQDDKRTGFFIQPGIIISDDTRYHTGDTVWVEVKPVKYYILEKTKTLVSDKCLLSGIKFMNYESPTPPIDYDNSNVKWYMDTYLKPKLLKNVSQMLKDIVLKAKEYQNILENNPMMTGGRVEELAEIIAPTKGISVEEVKKEINDKLEVLKTLPKEIIDAILDNRLDEVIGDDKEASDEDNKTPEEKEDSLNERSKEIISLRNQIKKYMRYSLDNSNSLETVDKLINNYNNSLVNNNELGLSLHTGTSDPMNLYTKLKLDLTEILNKLKENSVNVAGYFDMIDILTECKKEKPNGEYDELCSMIMASKEIINSFIINPGAKVELDEKLNEILDKHIKLCIDSIEEYKKSTLERSKKLDELKTDFRKEIRFFLLDLKKKVEEQDVVDSILERVKATIENQKLENDDKRISFFVKEINDVVTRIKRHGNEEELRELSKIEEDIQVDRTQDIHEVIGEYVNMLRKAMALELKIEDRINKEKTLKDMIIKFDDDSSVNMR